MRANLSDAPVEPLPLGSDAAPQVLFAAAAASGWHASIAPWEVQLLLA
jgi:hypothetical protein